jgi:hypothetical protein
VAILLNCFSLLNNLSTRLRSLYASLSNLPLCFSFDLRGIVMPMPRLAKYPRIRLFEYALSAATLAGKRLGLPLPRLLIAPPSINSSNTVDSCCSPGVSSNTSGLPAPSHLTWILVENPPLLRPSASFSGPSCGSPFLPQPRAGEHGRWSYLRNGLTTEPRPCCRHLSEPQPVFSPRYPAWSICRSEWLLFARDRIAQANLAKEHQSCLATAYR